MRFLISILLQLLFCTTLWAQNYSADTTLLLMGTRFELAAISNSKENSEVAVLAGIEEIKRIETLISSHQNTSITALINRNAGIKPVQVSEEYFQFISRCKRLSQLTDGAFDISFDPIYQLYRFDGSMKALPPTDSIKKYQQLIGFEHIEINEEKYSVFLKKRGMSIGFGAIGKGYAANRAKLIMLQKGAHSGFANASGDILFWGNNIIDELWNVAIASPFNKNEIVGNLKVSSMAVVTSGNYEKNSRLMERSILISSIPKLGIRLKKQFRFRYFVPMPNFLMV